MMDADTLAGSADLPKHAEPPPGPDAPEHIRAQWWRENVVRMKRPELAELVGVSVSRIVDIEAGENRTTKQPIDEATMRRYRLACAAVTLGVEFNWTSISLIPDTPVEIRLFGLGRSEK